MGWTSAVRLPLGTGNCSSFQRPYRLCYPISISGFIFLGAMLQESRGDHSPPCNANVKMLSLSLCHFEMLLHASVQNCKETQTDLYLSAKWPTRTDGLTLAGLLSSSLLLHCKTLLKLTATRCWQYWWDSVLCNNPYCGSPLMELNFVSVPSPQPETSLSRQTLLTDRKIKLMVSDMLVSLSWVSVRHLLVYESLRLSTDADWPPQTLSPLWVPLQDNSMLLFHQNAIISYNSQKILISATSEGYKWVSLMCVYFLAYFPVLKK
jgi:hypothetical protein